MTGLALRDGEQVLEINGGNVVYEILGDTGEFIALTDDPQEKRARLGFAIDAWNLACLPKKERTRRVTRFLAKLKNLDPTSNIQTMRHDLELLIENKLRMFPDEKREFVAARIDQNALGKDEITVISKPLA